MPINLLRVVLSSIALHHSRMMIVLLPVFVASISCSTDVDKSPAAPNMTNSVYESEIGKLRQEVDTLSDANKDHADSYKLSFETQKRSYDYLEKLSSNINDQSPSGLPTWQEMYDALVSDAAREDATFGLGSNRLQTNFYKQNQEIIANKTLLVKNEKDLVTIKGSLVEQEKTLQLHGGKIGELEREVAALNTLATTQTTHVNKVLEDYSARIERAEGSMKSLEEKFNIVRSNVAESVGTVTGTLNGIKQILADHDLQEMSRKIRDNTQTLDQQASTLSQMRTDLDTNKRNLVTFQDDLKKEKLVQSKQNDQYNSWNSQLKEITNKEIGGQKIVDAIAEVSASKAAIVEIDAELVAQAEANTQSQVQIDGSNAEVEALKIHVSKLTDEVKILEAKLKEAGINPDGTNE